MNGNLWAESSNPVASWIEEPAGHGISVGKGGELVLLGAQQSTPFTICLWIVFLALKQPSL